jgi:hypothetical protein
MVSNNATKSGTKIFFEKYNRTIEAITINKL